MDTLSAFARGEANRGKESMVFDWNKAAHLIKERNAKYANAGLEGDWEWTGGNIWDVSKGGIVEDDYTYLSSTWATPEIEIDGETEDCYLMQSQTENWDSETKWPDSAKAIIQSKL